METLCEARTQLEKRGFLDLPIDPSLDLVAAIQRLKREKNAVLLAHYYQTHDIQDIADYLGDSLYLARAATAVDADTIVFAGVHFMAETAKVLNPDKRVLLPDLHAGCSLAESCPPVEFARFKAQYPEAVVVTYINCSAEIKALSDIVCTSSNAERVIRSIPEDQPILFAPDKNLGRYLIRKTGRDMILWNGACIVHEAFSLERITDLMLQHPEAKLIAHPESETPVLNAAAFVGSTSALLNFAVADSAPAYIVATEEGILHEMKKRVPHKTLLPAPVRDAHCACSECAFMKRNTLEKLYLCMQHELPEIQLQQDLIDRARAPIQRMLEIS